MKNLDSANVKFKVKWRGGFGNRNKYSPISTDIQLESLDERVRTRIYNYFMEYYELKIDGYSYKKGFVNLFLSEFYLTDDTYSNRGEQYFLEALKDTIYKDKWFNVFSFIEFWCLAYKMRDSYTLDKFRENINFIFEIEFVGYRLIDMYIVPITDEIEIEAIEQTSTIPYAEVKKHISKSLKYLSDKENPDYENSIKESISSVETMVKIITENDKGSLGDALKRLEEKGIYIHPALKQAFLMLYGYTSDESGIRHSGKIGGKDSTFEEAKFMLVSCTAFNNYLLSNSK